MKEDALTGMRQSAAKPSESTKNRKSTNLRVVLINNLMATHRRSFYRLLAPF